MLSWFQANDKYLPCPRTISKHQKWSPGCILSQIDTLHRPLGRKPNFWWGSYWWLGAQSQIHRITLYYTGKSLFWPCTDPVRDCSASLHGFDANNQHQQSLKSYFLTSETDIFFQLLCGCTVSDLCSIHWPKKDSAFLNSIAFYSITNYVASWLKWLQMISIDSKWLYLTY